MKGSRFNSPGSRHCARWAGGWGLWLCDSGQVWLFVFASCLGHLPLGVHSPSPQRPTPHSCVWGCGHVSRHRDPGFSAAIVVTFSASPHISCDAVLVTALSQHSWRSSAVDDHPPGLICHTTEGIRVKSDSKWNELCTIVSKYSLSKLPSWASQNYPYPRVPSTQPHSWPHRYPSRSQQWDKRLPLAASVPWAATFTLAPLSSQRASVQTALVLGIKLLLIGLPWDCCAPDWPSGLWFRFFSCKLRLGAMRLATWNNNICLI